MEKWPDRPRCGRWGITARIADHETREGAPCSKWWREAGCTMVSTRPWATCLRSAMELTPDALPVYMSGRIWIAAYRAGNMTAYGACLAGLDIAAQR